MRNVREFDVGIDLESGLVARGAGDVDATAKDGVSSDPARKTEAIGHQFIESKRHAFPRTDEAAEKTGNRAVLQSMTTAPP
jgi:hypothetical protein